MKKIGLYCWCILIVAVSGFLCIQTAEAGNKPRVRKGHDFTNVPAGAKFEKGELLVRFAPKVRDGDKNVQRSKKEKMDILKSLGGGNIKREYWIVPGLTLVKLPPGQTVEKALKKFNRKGEILYAEPNYEVEISSTFPNDTYFDDQWNMHNTGQSGGTVDADIDAPEAWDTATDSSNIVVAVIDTGVDYNHPDLAGNMWVNEGEFYGTPNVDDDENGYIDDVYGYDFCNDDGDPCDDRGHGTHVSGIIGAVGDNNEGVAGVCWNVKIMAIKFLDDSGRGTYADAVSSVEYAALMDVDLMNASWSGGYYHQSLKDAIESAGILFVAAAGNYIGPINNDLYPRYPACYDLDDIVAVLATNRYDNFASHRYGVVSVDLGAPGSDILSCVPEEVYGYQYKLSSGSSMAAPHVTGASALMWVLDVWMSNQQIKQTIMTGGVDHIIQMSWTCASKGRLNLHKALTCPRILEIQCYNGTGWVGPAEIERDQLQKVRAKCKDVGGSVESVTFKLENLSDSTLFFDHNATSNQGTWWYYDNNDIHLYDSGNYRLTVTCTDNDDLETGYYEGWTVWGLRVRNSSNETVAWFDNVGNLLLAGTLDEQSTPTLGGNDELRIQDANSTDIVIVDANTGNMYITGEAHENQQTLQTSGNDDVIFKNDDGEVISYVDESGNIYLKGILSENDPQL